MSSRKKKCAKYKVVKRVQRARGSLINHVAPVLAVFPSSATAEYRFVRINILIFIFFFPNTISINWTLREKKCFKNTITERFFFGGKRRRNSEKHTPLSRKSCNYYDVAYVMYHQQLSFTEKKMKRNGKRSRFPFLFVFSKNYCCSEISKITWSKRRP